MAQPISKNEGLDIPNEANGKVENYLSDEVIHTFHLFVHYLLTSECLCKKVLKDIANHTARSKYGRAKLDKDSVSDEFNILVFRSTDGLEYLLASLLPMLLLFSKRRILWPKASMQDCNKGQATLKQLLKMQAQPLLKYVPSPKSHPDTSHVLTAILPQGANGAADAADNTAAGVRIHFEKILLI